MMLQLIPDESTKSRRLSTATIVLLNRQLFSEPLFEQDHKSELFSSSQIMQRLKWTNTSRDLIGLQSSLGGSNETLDSPQRPRGRTTDSIDLPKINQTPNQPQDERGISVAQTLRPYSTKRIKSFPRSKTQQELNQLEEAFPGIKIKLEAVLKV